MNKHLPRLYYIFFAVVARAVVRIRPSLAPKFRMLRQFLRFAEYREAYANALKVYFTEQRRRQLMVMPRLSG